MADEQRTFFHVPEAPKQYRPGQQSARPGGYGADVDAHVPLPVGTTVTLHGYAGMLRVVRSHYHVGQPDEEPGLHIFLERIEK